VFGSLPAYPQPCQGSADGLAADPRWGQPLLEAYFGGQVQRPQAGGLLKAPGAVVQQLPQPLNAFRIEGGLGGVRA
jgi:hypothetical protein